MPTLDNSQDFSYKWFALIGLSLLSFTVFLDFTIVTTALPYIQKDLNASVLTLQWITNIFGMMTCMFMIVSGQAGDIFGRKKVFFIGFILFGIAALGAALSPSIQWLIFFRGMQGFSAAIIATVGVALLPQAFPKNEQASAIGIFSAFNAAGLALGPFVGGILITLFSWRAVFFVNIPIIFIGLALSIFTLKPSPELDHKVYIDWWGLILLIVGTGCLVYGIIQSEQIGWQEIQTQVFFFIGIVSLSTLFIVENNVTHPLLDLELFKNKDVLLSMLICISAGMIVFVFLFFDPLYLELMRNLTPFLIGLYLFSIPLISVLISLLFPRLIKKFGVSHLILFGIFTALFASLLHILFTPAISFIFLLIVFMLMGYTWSLSNNGTIVAINENVKPSRIGAGIGTVFTLWNLSGSIFLALATILFHARQEIAFKGRLIQENLNLSPAEQGKIELFLQDPSQYHAVMTHFTSDKATIVAKAYQYSFMNAFHWVAALSSLILFIIVLIGLKIRWIKK